MKRILCIVALVLLVAGNCWAAPAASGSASGPLTVTGTATVTESVTTPQIYGSSAENGDIIIEGTSSGTKTTSYVDIQPGGGTVRVGNTTSMKGDEGVILVYRNGTEAVRSSFSTISAAYDAIVDSSATKRYTMEIYGYHTITATQSFNAAGIDLIGENARVLISSNTVVTAASFGIYFDGMVKDIVFESSGSGTVTNEPVVSISSNSAYFENVEAINNYISTADPLTPDNSGVNTGNRLHGIIIRGSSTFVNCIGRGSNGGNHDTRGIYIESWGTDGEVSPLLIGCRGYGGGVRGVALKPTNRCHGIIIHTSASATLINCIGYAGGDDTGTDSSGIKFQSVPGGNIENCIGYGKSTTSGGIYVDYASNPILKNCSGFAGKNDAAYGLRIANRAFPNVIGGYYGPAEINYEWGYAAVGKFRPDESKPYTLKAIQVWINVAHAGQTIDIGTGVGGNQIASGVSIAATGWVLFEFTEVDIVAGEYIYITPSEALADDDITLNVKVVNNNAIKSAYVDTSGAIKFSGTNFFAPPAGDGVYLATSMATNTGWSMDQVNIRCDDETQNAIEAQTAFADAPISGVIRGKVSGITTYADSVLDTAPRSIPVTNSDFGLCSNSTLENDGSDLVINGGATSDTSGWSVTRCTLASVAGGQDGNCFELTTVSGSSQYFYNSAITTVVGKLYKLLIYVKSGTSGDESFNVKVWDGSAYIGTLSGTTTAAWVQHTLVFEATSTTTNMEIFKNTATAGTMLFDTVQLFKAIPGFVAADALAPDDWRKDSTADVYRDDTTVKDGIYSLKIVSGAAADYAYWPSYYDKPAHYAQYAGKRVRFRMWVKTDTASHARLRISDSAGSSNSSYHSGGNTWELLTVERTVPASITSFDVELRTELSGNTAYFAPYDPPIPGEVIWAENDISITKLDGLSNESDVSATALVLEAQSSGKVPKGVKAIHVRAHVNDSGSAGTDCYLMLRSDATQVGQFIISPAGLANNMVAKAAGWQKCTTDGDVQYMIDASGSNTFDIPIFKVLGVQLR